mgnify:CR=1 FL=1
MTKFKMLVGLLPLLLWSCASDEELFAKYDQFCNNKICMAQIAEVQYSYLPPDYAVWEPAVYFGFDKDTLVGRELERLTSNIDVLKKHPDYLVSIRGFTDSFNSQAYNLVLSTRRQGAVFDYLVSQGISAKRIIASKAGELLPIKDSEAQQDRILNRRVEMLLLDSNGRPLSFGIDTDRRTQEVFEPPLPLDRPAKGG